MLRPYGKKKERRDKPRLRQAAAARKSRPRAKKRPRDENRSRDGHPKVAATRDEARKCRLCRTFLAANASDSWKIPLRWFHEQSECSAARIGAGNVAFQCRNCGLRAERSAAISGGDEDFEERDESAGTDRSQHS